MTKDPSKTPLYCSYLFWLLRASDLIDDATIGKVGKEVIRQAERMLDVEWAVLRAGVKQLERITTSAKTYLGSLPEMDDAVLEKEVRGVFMKVLEERKRYWAEQATEEPEMEQPAPVVTDGLDPAVEQFVRSVVDTDLFAKQYFERLRKAANGDLTPIVTFMVKFTQRTGVEGGLLQVLARRYLEVSRESLGAPEDEELWTSILTRVIASLHV